MEYLSVSEHVISWNQVLANRSQQIQDEEVTLVIKPLLWHIHHFFLHLRLFS